MHRSHLRVPTADMTHSGADDAAQLLASMKSVIALYRNLGPVVTAHRMQELRAIVERECQWTSDHLAAFGDWQPEARSYALMLRQMASQLERLGQLTPGLGLGTVTPGGGDPASQLEAAVGGIETLARSLEERVLGR